MVKEPESIWIDRGPLGGWMFRTERLHDSVRQYVPADCIEALKAEVERLREALGWIAKWCEEEENLEYNDAMRKAFQRNMGEAARAALETKL